MIAVIATLHCEADNEEHLVSALKTLQFHSRQESGCERYDLARRELDDKIQLVVTELWEDKAALDAHFHAEHFTRFGSQASDIVLDSEIIQYEVIED